jgi:hypothetical protein
MWSQTKENLSKLGDSGFSDGSLWQGVIDL